MTRSVAAHRAATRDRLNLALLLVLMTACAWLLQRVGGWPHPPGAMPSWRVVGITLQGSSIPGEAVIYLLSTAAWLLWFYVAFCIALNTAVVVGERLTPGGPWIEGLREVASRVTLPIIQRTVEAALVATFLINVGTRSVPLAMAASPSPVAAAVAAPAQAGTASAKEPDHVAVDGVEYTVQPADTLWSIASRFYGAGADYPRLVEANTGRITPDGRTFTAAGVIHPGWKLRIPLPSPVIDESSGQLKYIVQPNDSLSEIAARLLGDEDRWQELYAANRNVSRLPDGRTLTAPDLIWPGLPITLPQAPAPKPAVQISAPAVQIPAPQPAPEQPVQAAEPITPSASADASVAPAPVEVGPAPATSGGRPPLTLLYGLAGGLAAMGGGAAVLARSRRARRSLSEPPPLPDEDLPAVVGGFAEAELSRGLSHRIDGDELEPAVVIAGQVDRFLAGRGLTDAPVIAVRYAGNHTALLLQCGLGQQRQLESAVADLQRVFQCSAQIQPTVDRDILLTLRGLKLAKLVSLGWEAAGSPLLIPAALLPQCETLYVEWTKAGPALLAGANGSDVETVLVSLLAGLAARRSPDQLRLVAIGSPQTLPGPLAELPHLPRGVIDQASADMVCQAIDEVKRELLARMDAAADGTEERPLVVLAIAELAAMDQSLYPAIETIAMDAGAHGVLLLAATGRPDDLTQSLVDEFKTQIVLRLLNEDHSTRLLGEADAVDLAGGGDLFIRVNGRTALRGRGFQVGVEHLDELRRLMAQAHSPAATPGGGQQEDAVPEATAEPQARPHEADPYPAAEQADEPLSPLKEVKAAGGPPGDPPDIAELPLPMVVPEESTECDLDDAFAVMQDDVEPPEPAAEAEVPDEMALAVHEDVVPETRAPLQQPLPEPEVPAGDGRSSQALLAEVSARVAERMGTVAASDPPSMPVPSDTVIEVRCFGGLTVSHKGQPVSPKARGVSHHQSWEILALVASQPNGQISKEKLGTLFWPDATPQEVKNRLHQALHRLRLAVAGQVAGANGEYVRIEAPGLCRLESGVVWSDVQEFVALCRKAGSPDHQTAKHAAVKARALYRGDLLADMPYSWVHDRTAGLSLQEQYRQDYVGLTVQLARLFMDDGQPQLAVPLYKEILSREPTLEDVIRPLYGCYAAMGNRAALVQEHRHLQEVLTEVFQGDPLAKPQPETIAAYQEALASLRAQASRDQELAASA
jgi:DNA-binding SARP family transcriptional activator/nucleoid-associated protein YgaU